MKIGLQIRIARKDRGMTQLDLARELGRNYSHHISDYERGVKTPNLHTLQKISDILDTVFLIG